MASTIIRIRRAAVVVTVALLGVATLQPPVAGAARWDTAADSMRTIHPAIAEIATDRIAGANRFDTAARVAAARPGSSGVVIVANGQDPKQGFDALASNYLAGIVDAPILLTNATQLPQATADAVRGALAAAAVPGAVQILVMGQADSVSDAVVDQLNTIARTVTGHTQNYVQRVGGDNRYHTSVLAATFLGDDPTGARIGRYTWREGSGPAKTAILASGEVNADALAAGPLSNALHIPVLLTGSTRLPDSVAGTLSQMDVGNLIVLGGPDRIPPSVVDAAATAAGGAETIRIAGSNRYDTSARLYRFAREQLSDPNGQRYAAAPATPLYLANGDTGFPDALAAGPLAAHQRALLLTVPQGHVPTALDGTLADWRGTVGSVTALGQDATVADAVLAQVRAALQ